MWFRPEGRLFLTGKSPAPDREPPVGDLEEIDHAFFEDEIWPRLAARVPAFESVKVVNAWAAYYDTDTLDHSAVIGAHPEIANLCFANGFSGHGAQQAAAAGRAIAELIVDGAYRTIDLTRLGYARIAAGAAAGAECHLSGSSRLARDVTSVARPVWVPCCRMPADWTARSVPRPSSGDGRPVASPRRGLPARGIFASSHQERSPVGRMCLRWLALTNEWQLRAPSASARL